MASVILQPNSMGKPGGEHPTDGLRRFLTNDEYARLTKAAPDGQVVAYGKADPDESRWERAKAGDIALFYHRRTYFASARLALKVRNGKLARYLWGSNAESDQGLHDRLLFFSGLRPLRLPASVLNPVVGFSPSYVLYRFQVVPTQRVSRLKAILRDRRYSSASAHRVAADLAFVQEIDSVVEGQDRLIQHIRRERKRNLILAKRADVLRRTGRLRCEACGFDSRRKYPWIEQDFAEVHHKQPMSGADGPRRTAMADLAILCANCHRMIHRTVPMMPVPQFRRAVQARGA